MASKNVVLVDKQKNQLAPATVAEQVAIDGSNVKSIIHNMMLKTSLYGMTVTTLTETVTVTETYGNIKATATFSMDDYENYQILDFYWIVDPTRLNNDIFCFENQVYNQVELSFTNPQYPVQAGNEVTFGLVIAYDADVDNAELTDIRLGADEVTYDTAGEAVRTQLNGKVPYPLDDGDPDYGEEGQALISNGDGTTAWGQGGGGLSEDAKQAILNAFQHVAWIDEHGQDYYDDIYDAFYPPVHATSITLNTDTLSFTSIGATQTLTATVHPADATDEITWESSNTGVCTVSSSGVVTSVSYGTCDITVTAGEVSATCSVVVAQATLVSINVTYTQSGTVYDTDSLDSLKSDLVVLAVWSDSSQTTVPSTDYTLSGTLTAGTSTITVSYAGKSGTFTVNVTVQPNGLVDGTYTNGSVVITVSNNVLSYGSTTSGYKNFSIPLVRQIELHAGDVVQFVGSNGNPTGNNSVPIGLNDETYLTNFSPYKSPSASKSTTLSADMTLTHIRTQAQTAQANSSFTLSMIVNDEVIF